MKLLLITALSSLLLAGCSTPSNLTELMKAKSDDHAYVKGDVMTPYGSGHFQRFNPATNQSMKITSPDGTVVEITTK